MQNLEASKLAVAPRRGACSEDYKLTASLTTRLGVGLALALVAACSSSEGTKPASGATPGSTADAAAATPAGPVALPFLLSDEFAPSGYMGDSTDDFSAVSMSKDGADCLAPRAIDAAGDCYSVTWNPVLASGAPSAWVGVYWQYPANNWGAMGGKAVAAGATKVTFQAAGAAGGESLRFVVGGVNVKGSDPPLPNKDAFEVGLDVTLTTAWTQYEIPLTAATYDAVIGGFAWVAKATSASPVRFYVDDVRWEK
jgi:hypothetical protein